MTILYYADSLGLSRVSYVALDQRYIYIFEEWLRQNKNEKIFLINRARRGFTIDKLYDVYKEDQDYIEESKDLLIIHEGVCDCAPRPISTPVRKLVSRLPGFIRKRVIYYLHKNRARLLTRGSVHFLVTKPEYERILTEWLTDAVQRYKTICLFNIAPTNPQIETHSPGFGKSIEDYNAIMQKVVNSLDSPKITLIDIHSIIKKAANINDLIIAEDGHHLTAQAHRIYADLLIELVQQAGRTYD